jgi:hypothetical protein
MPAKKTHHPFYEKLALVLIGLIALGYLVIQAKDVLDPRKEIAPAAQRIISALYFAFYRFYFWHYVSYWVADIRPGKRLATIEGPGSTIHQRPTGLDKRSFSYQRYKTNELCT